MPGGRAGVSGEPIRLEAPSRRDAVLLAEALGSLGAEVRKLDSHWEVVIPPDHQAAELLIEGFDAAGRWLVDRSEEHTSELQSRSDLVCRLLLEKKKTQQLPHS